MEESGFKNIIVVLDFSDYSKKVVKEMLTGRALESVCAAAVH